MVLEGVLLMGVMNEDFLFIHIPKTAGSAVKFWLLEHLPRAEGQRPDDPASSKAAGYPIGHIPLRHIVNPPAHWREQLGTRPRPADSFHKVVAIIRNPYHQQVSQYRFWLQRGQAYWEGHAAELDFHDPNVRTRCHPHDYGALRAWFDAGHDEQQGFRLWLTRPTSCDFHLWYEARQAPGDRWRPATPDQAFDYYRWWLEVDGEIPPNVEVVKMEYLYREWPRIMSDFVMTDAPLPVVNSHAKGCPPLATFYTQEATRLVEQKFAWTFDNHYHRGEW